MNISLLIDDGGITFSMNQKGGMVLYYQGYAYIKKSSAGDRQYWKCQHSKPLNCR